MDEKIIENPTNIFGFTIDLLLSISFISSIEDINQDQIEPSFISTQLFQGTFLAMDYNERSRQESLSIIVDSI